jgi:hypothetical protein
VDIDARRLYLTHCTVGEPAAAIDRPAHDSMPGCVLVEEQCYMLDLRAPENRTEGACLLLR